MPAAKDRTTPLPLLDAMHTSDLCDQCLRRVRLRHEGKADPEIGSALFRGTFAHEALERLHRAPVSEWSSELAMKVCQQAVSATNAKIESEDRIVSAAAHNSAAAMYGEIEQLLKEYVARIGPELEACRIIAVEAPINLTIEVDGEYALFRSHLDLLFRDNRGTLHIWDWKSGTDAPSFDFLARNLQLGIYWLAALQGEIMISPDDWVAFNEPPLVSWIHLNHLKPFGRKTRLIEDGVQVEYLKGDRRPINKIIRQISYQNIDAILDELSDRVRMARSGIFPMNPEPVRCSLCECRHACETFADHPELERT